MQNSKTEQNNNQEWQTERVGDLTLHSQYGWTTSAKKEINGLKLLRTTDISSGNVNWDTVPVCLEAPDQVDKYLLKDGDILVSRAGSVGLSYYIENPPKAVFASYLIRFQAREEKVKSKYLYYFFQSQKYWDAIGAGKSGIAIPNVNATKLADIQVDYPKNLVEQEKIIRNLDIVLAQVKIGTQKITKAKKLMNDFRQTILTAAITGKLTNINYEKQEFSGAMEIPSNWKKVPLKQAVLSLATGPFGSTLHHQDYISGGIPVINPINIIKQSIVPSSEVTVSQETKERLSSYILNKNDIVIARRGEMGRCAVVTEKEDGWLCGTGCFIIRPSDVISSEYLSLIISSVYGVSYLSEHSVGTTMQNLNLGILGNMLIPLPEISEQQEILNKIRQYFDISNQIERQIERAEVRVSKLTQAILAKTFNNSN